MGQGDDLAVGSGEVQESIAHQAGLGDRLDGRFRDRWLIGHLCDHTEVPPIAPMVIRGGRSGDAEDPGAFGPAIGIELIVIPPRPKHCLGGHLFGIPSVAEPTHGPSEHCVTVIRTDATDERLSEFWCAHPVATPSRLTP